MQGSFDNVWSERAAETLKTARPCGIQRSPEYSGKEKLYENRGRVSIGLLSLFHSCGFLANKPVHLIARIRLTL